MTVLHVASDYHLDIPHNAWEGPVCDDYDIAAILGDACAPGSHGLRALRRMYMDRSRPLIYVQGNHDFYSEGDPKKRVLDPSLQTTWENERRIMRDVANELDITLLDDDSVEIDGIRFVGGTLWTGYDARNSYEDMNAAMRSAAGRGGMNDFRYIKTGAGRSRDVLTPRDTLGAHRRTVRFIEATLAEPFAGPTVVLTHHAPSYRSLRGWNSHMPGIFRAHDYCYASDLEYLMHGDNAPSIWAHGHVHENRDYTVGGTRVLANPRGYPLTHGLGPEGRENGAFNPMLTVEIEPIPAPRMGM